MAAKNKIDAYIEYLADEHNIIHVELPEGFIVVKRTCNNCHHYMTEKTKYCYSPSSRGCWQFEYKLKG